MHICCSVCVCGCVGVCVRVHTCVTTEHAAVHEDLHSLVCTCLFWCSRGLIALIHPLRSGVSRLTLLKGVSSFP